MLELLGAIASGLAAVGGRLAHFIRPTPSPQPAPAPMEPQDQWARASRYVTAAIARCGHIESLQAAAAYQIDAADYGLRRLMLELATAMPIAADGAPLRAILAEAERKPVRSVAAGKALAA